MGREVRRTPLGFDAPLNKVWEGYINPWGEYFEGCFACGGSGSSRDYRQLEQDWYDFADTGRRWCNAITQDEVDALVESGRLYDLTHVFAPGEGWKPKDPPVHPTAEQVNEWSRAARGLSGHDAINRWICVEQRAKRLGILRGLCTACHGTGSRCLIPQVVDWYNAWEETEPPEGDGYQIWETTSEGSPITPSLPSPEELARWCVDNAVSAFGGQGASYEGWLRVAEGGYAPSAVGGPAGLVSGVDSL